MQIMNFLEQLDHRLFFLINSGMGREWLDKIFEELSSLGTWTIGIVAFAFLADSGRRVFGRHLLVLLVVLVVASPLSTTLKRIVRRPRPLKQFQEQIENGTLTVRIVERKSPSRRSFPSGHSMLAFYFMTYVALCRPSYRFWALLLAALIAFSRVYVGLHFPSDCLVGSLLGAAGGWVAWLAFRRLNVCRGESAGGSCQRTA